MPVTRECSTCSINCKPRRSVRRTNSNRVRPSRRRLHRRNRSSPRRRWSSRPLRQKARAKCRRRSNLSSPKKRWSRSTRPSQNRPPRRLPRASLRPTLRIRLRCRRSNLGQRPQAQPSTRRASTWRVRGSSWTSTKHWNSMRACATHRKRFAARPSAMSSSW